MIILPLLLAASVSAATPTLYELADQIAPATSKTPFGYTKRAGGLHGRSFARGKILRRKDERERACMLQLLHSRWPDGTREIVVEMLAVMPWGRIPDTGIVIKRELDEERHGSVKLDGNATGLLADRLTREDMPINGNRNSLPEDLKNTVLRTQDVYIKNRERHTGGWVIDADTRYLSTNADGATGYEQRNAVSLEVDAEYKLRTAHAPLRVRGSPTGPLVTCIIPEVYTSRRPGRTPSRLQ